MGLEVRSIDGKDYLVCKNQADVESCPAGPPILLDGDGQSFEVCDNCDAIEIANAGRVRVRDTVTGDVVVRGTVTGRVSVCGTVTGCVRAPVGPFDDEQIRRLDVITQIIADSPESFLMWTYHCGTAHCLAGWGQITSGKEIDSLTADRDGAEYLPSVKNLFYLCSRTQQIRQWLLNRVYATNPTTAIV
jgi:hypothetical protein